jgi:hypothetical protein
VEFGVRVGERHESEKKTTRDAKVEGKGGGRKRERKDNREGKYNQICTYIQLKPLLCTINIY